MRLFPLLLVVACAAGPGAASRLDRVPTGDWGGEHVRLTVTESGGTIEFDCAHGTLDEPLALDAERPLRRQGPPRRGGRPHPARTRRERALPPAIAATSDGRLMSLEVTLEGGESAGTFSLAKGGAARLFKCR